jgi:NADH:ubiquinone oxidoreductase subunit 2 (subunit N)
MVLGGLRAVAVASPRALVAWLVVQQVGWLAAGLAAHDQRGFAAALFVLVPLLVAATAGPLLAGASDLPLVRVAGLGRREPARALGLALVLLSLAGVPPLAGFFGEFTVAVELVRSGLAWVLASGLLGSVLCTAAVVRTLRLVYLEVSPEEARGGSSRRQARWVAGPFVPALLVLAYGLFANPIHNLAVQGARALGLH